LSLGAERLFRLKGQDGAVALAERLSHGSPNRRLGRIERGCDSQKLRVENKDLGCESQASLLIMAGKTQKNFKHEVPKEPNITEPRINLTFRHIEHS
jgi:alkylated DNA repair dioxygenase AlkB